MAKPGSFAPASLCPTKIFGKARPAPVAICTFLALLPALISSVRAASALEQIKANSKLPTLDLAQLKSGAIVTHRGPFGEFPLGLYAESAYFIHAPVAGVGEKMLHWNAAAHAELEISKLHEYRWPGKADDWDSLSLNSSRPDDRWLIDRTRQSLSTSDASADLHLTAADIAAFRNRSGQPPGGASATHGDSMVNAFWREILESRSDALARGGLKALPIYSANGVRVDAHAQFAELLKLAPRVAAHFRALLDGRPFVAAAVSGGEIVPYWEVASVRGHTNLHNAFIVAQKGSGSWQVADCTYYVSDTYFLSFSLYQLWAENEGTVVWQIDFAAAPFHSLTGGLDRVFAGKEMEKDAVEIARAFRGDVEKGR